MVPLNSSNLAGYEYDAESGDLTITFKRSGVYVYSGVPETVPMDLESAPSPGIYFGQFIKDNYPYRKVG